MTYHEVVLLSVIDLTFVPPFVRWDGYCLTSCLELSESHCELQISPKGHCVLLQTVQIRCCVGQLIHSHNSSAFTLCSKQPQILWDSKLVNMRIHQSCYYFSAILF